MDSLGDPDSVVGLGFLRSLGGTVALSVRDDDDDYYLCLRALLAGGPVVASNEGSAHGTTCSTTYDAKLNLGVHTGREDHLADGCKGS